MRDPFIERRAGREIHFFFPRPGYAPDAEEASMSKPYDATLKELLEIEPTDWPQLVGLAPERVDVIDADVSTVTAAADKVLRLHGPSPSLMAVEFQSRSDDSLPLRLHMYNAILEHRHGLPVRSLVLLLTPQADHSNLTGLHQSRCADEEPHVQFRYRVIRLWQIPKERLLSGGLAMLALAPLGAVREEELPGVIERVADELRQRVDAPLRGKLWTAIFVAMGLRYEQPVVSRLLRGVHEMEESVTYQWIIEKGKQKGIEQGREEGALSEARKMLILAGEQVLGAPDVRARKTIEAIPDVELLEQLTGQLGQARSWNHLLGLPASRSRTRRRKSNS
jgi:predicted transposase YdaD